MTSIVTWLIRYGHVLSATCWVGGYALLALVIIPVLKKGPNKLLTQMAITVVRVLTYTGTLTIGFGLVLVMYTRGYANLLHSKWGMLVLGGIVIAVVLLGIGDGALRPAIKRLPTSGDARKALLWAGVGFALTVIAIGLMTAAVYVVG